MRSHQLVDERKGLLVAMPEELVPKLILIVLVTSLVEVVHVQL
jgi:hypothetical protein